MLVKTKLYGAIISKKGIHRFLLHSFYTHDPKTLIVRTEAFIYELFRSLWQIKITHVDASLIFFASMNLLEFLASKKLNNRSFLVLKPMTVFNIILVN